MSRGREVCPHDYRRTKSSSVVRTLESTRQAAATHWSLGRGPRPPGTSHDHQPHLAAFGCSRIAAKSFKLSPDDAVTKRARYRGLVHPSTGHAGGAVVDEKSQIQVAGSHGAIVRMRPGGKPNGTRTITRSWHHLAVCRARPLKAQVSDWQNVIPESLDGVRKFLDRVDASVPPDQEPKSSWTTTARTNTAIRALVRQTPTAFKGTTRPHLWAWLNLVERWFAEITMKQISARSGAIARPSGARHYEFLTCTRPVQSPLCDKKRRRNLGRIARSPRRRQMPGRTTLYEHTVQDT